MIFTETQERVRRGAQMLDRKNPDWFNEIDLDVLDLNDCHACILGQLYGTYSEGRYRIGLDWDLQATGSHGFTVWPRDHIEDLDDFYSEEERLWDQLYNAWKEEITKRRANALHRQPV